MVDIESDTVSMMSEMSSAGFSTISGGTVIHRADSSHYAKLGGRSASGSSIASDPGAFGRTLSTSRDNIFVSDFTSLQNIPEQSMMDTRKAPPRLRRNNPVNDSVSDVYVTLKPPSGNSNSGMRLLSDNYASEEDSSGSTGKLSAHTDVNESLKNMTPKTDINRMKSISAQDLQTTPKIETPSRARADSTCLSDTASLSSPFCSPSRKFNHKPRLQISRETHKLLTRAGFLAPQSGTDTTRLQDVPVPVKSPERSSHREEMMHTLRASFHETRRSLSTSTSSRGSHYRSLRCAGERTYSGMSYDRVAVEWDRPLQSSTALEADSPQSLTTVTNRVVEMSAKLDTDPSEKYISPVEDDGDMDTQDAPVPSGESSDIALEEKTKEGCNTQVNDQSQPSDHVCVEKTDEFQLEEPRKMESKKMSGNKSLTLSKILDKELLEHGPVRIKRAQISLPKHDSIANIQEVKAGSVAQTVKQFTQQNNSNAKQTTSKRGTSPIRIPTIFAKTEEKVRQYREITSFARERLNSREERRSPQKMLSDSDIESDTSMSDGNVTILEMKHHSNSPDHMEESPRGDSRHSVVIQNGVEAPCKRQCVELSDSLVETIKDLKSSFKSPLRESTNTADSRLNDKPVTPDAVSENIYVDSKNYSPS